MNYIDKNIKTIDENDTVGIIICKQDNKYVIKYCSDDRIIAREYELVWYNNKRKILVGSDNMTTIYLMRHSEPLKVNHELNNDSLQTQNEKCVLSKNGEKLAKEKSKNKELQNFDVVISSNYVRAISTAKYFTDETIIIDERFGERKFGIDSWDELPKDFGEKQFDDFNYKMKNGESINEVIKREEEALNEVLEKYKKKKVLIVGHSTAEAALLSKWCKINYSGPYTFNNKEFFDGKWNYTETFKLEFDDNNNLVSIKNIR